VLALERGAELVAVAEVSADEADPVEVEVRTAAEGLVVDDRDLVAAGPRQVVGQVDADEAGPSSRSRWLITVVTPSPRIVTP
jgi:hypothetical protein